MKIIIDSSKPVELSLAPKTRADAIAQQLYVILKTVHGECPMYRDFGTNHAYKDMPMNIAQSMYVNAISEAIRKFSPEVSLVRVDFSNESACGEAQKCIIEVKVNE